MQGLTWDSNSGPQALQASAIPTEQLRPLYFFLPYFSLNHFESIQHQVQSPDQCIVSHFLGFYRLVKCNKNEKKCMETSTLKASDLPTTVKFVIIHVFTCMYIFQDFREKNSDQIKQDILSVLKSSSLTFVKELMGKNLFVR